VRDKFSARFAQTACFLFRLFSLFVFISAGTYVFAHSEDGDFFNEYLFGALHVESYEPIYFMPYSYDFTKHDDRDPVEALFQLSFKKNVAQNISPLGFDIGIAFTQTVWWQLYVYSNPIRETNYAPEFYFFFPINRESGEEGIFFRGVKLALAHKSNGREKNNNNRSWNRVILEAPVSIKRFMFIPKIWWSFKGIGNDFSEKDIPKYMGMCDLTVISHWRKHVLRIYGRTNFNFKNLNSGLQVDYSYPIGESGVYIYLKYFLGYGESLLDYKQKVNKIGTGISLSR
jgi:phospholipase A1/A2